MLTLSAGNAIFKSTLSSFNDRKNIPQIEVHTPVSIHDHRDHGKIGR